MLVIGRIAAGPGWVLPPVVVLSVIWAGLATAQSPPAPVPSQPAAAYAGPNGGGAEATPAPAEAAPSITGIRIDSHRVTFEGLGVAGRFVDVRQDQRLLGIATVDDKGHWGLVIEQPLPIGEHRITASSRAVAGTELLAGPVVLVSIPEGFTGLAKLSQPAGAGREGATLAALEAELQRRHAEEMAAAVSEHFSEILATTQWQRIVEPKAAKETETRREPAATEAPAAVAAPFAAINGWFQHGARAYHEQVVHRLSAPPAAEVRHGQTETSLLGGVQDWLTQSRREYHTDIVSKLSLPASLASSDGAGRPPPPPPQAMPAANTMETRAAAERQKVEAERKAEADRAEARRLANAKRTEDERQAAEAARVAKADEAMRVREAAAHAAERKAQLEAQRLASLDLKAKEDATRASVDSRPAASSLLDSGRGSPARVAAGFRSEADYRRVMLEAARAPKVRPDATPPSRRTKPAAERRASLDTDKMHERRSAASVSAFQSLGFKSEDDYRRALIQASRAPKVLPERGSRRSDGSRAQPVREAANRPPHQEQRLNLGAGRAAPPPGRREERPVADCPAAGRQISLPGTYVVRNGDTLWRIAQRHYGDGVAYPRIARANRATVPDPDLIEPCQSLVLPGRANR